MKVIHECDEQGRETHCRISDWYERWWELNE